MHGKLSIAIALLAIVSVVCGCSTPVGTANTASQLPVESAMPDSTPQPAATDSNYMTLDNSLQFLLPAGWQVDDTTMGGNGMVTLQPLEGGARGLFMLFPMPGGTKPEELNQVFSANIQMNVKNSKVILQDTRQIHGNDQYYFELTGSDVLSMEDVPNHYLYFFVVKENTVYMGMLSAPESEYSNYQETFEKIASSMVVLEKDKGLQ